MRLSNLQNKTVVNVTDGKNIGNIIDLEIDENGSASGLVVEKYKFLISSFSNKKELIIKWDQIKKIGEDVILVDIVY
jgi:YlmC/YmxH family sporulation protein